MGQENPVLAVQKQMLKKFMDIFGYGKSLFLQDVLVDQHLESMRPLQHIVENIPVAFSLG